MTWFRVGGAGIPASLKNNMNSVLNKKFGTTGQNYPPNGWPDDVNLLGPLPEKTVAGAIAHTDDAADTVPVKSMICSIVPIQEGSGTPSPINPRAISGYTGMNITHSGKNLLLSSNTDISQTTLNGIRRSYSLDNQEYTFEGINTKTDASWIIFSINSSDYVLNGLKFGVTYRFSHNLPDVMYSQITYNKSGGGIGSIVYLRGNAGRNASVSFTLPSDFSSFRQFQIGVINTASAVNITAHFQIEVGSSASSFEKYNAVADVSDSWSSIGTIYGGERDLIEGTLKKTHEYISSYNGESINEPWISSIDEYVPGTTPSTGAQVVYPLTIPVDYSNLSTYDFETLYAVNNFYSDIEGGQTQVTYRQDIALALASLQGSRSLSASLMRSAGPEEVSEPEENIQNTEETEGESDER